MFNVQYESIKEGNENNQKKKKIINIRENYMNLLKKSLYIKFLQVFKYFFRKIYKL